jgi:hypothetical protein
MAYIFDLWKTVKGAEVAYVRRSDGLTVGLFSDEHQQYYRIHYPGRPFTHAETAQIYAFYGQKPKYSALISRSALIDDFLRGLDAVLPPAPPAPPIADPPIADPPIADPPVAREIAALRYEIECLRCEIEGLRDEIEGLRARIP